MATRNRLAALVVLLLTISGLTFTSTAAKAATSADPCGSGGNAIACENSKPGAPPSEWDIDGAGDDDIQGFANDISVDVGHKIDFKIDTDASAYTITIYRTGWYGGDGAREIDTVTPSATLPQQQPNCLWDASTELTDCGNWNVSASWNVPSTAVSGVYIALLKRTDNGNASHITFVVRDDASHSDVVYQTSDPTWEAYNSYGGSDFYKGGDNGRAYKVSYNRPFATRSGTTSHDFYFANEYPAVRFLERNGYDVSYIAGVDTDRSGSLLTSHKVFLSVGHDEYWSGQQRANVTAARDAGLNLQFLSGNEVYWRTRYEPSVDGSNTPYRTLVTYKEAWAQTKLDPSPESTSTWRDPRYSPKSEGGGLPENALTGTIFMSNLSDLPVTVTKAEGKLRLWRGTGLDSMTAASTPLAPHTVGYESDEDQDNGSRPPGTIDLSTTTGFIQGQYMTDFGKTVGDGTTTHSITLYRAPSGALVFGAGSVQWAWGLDAEHDSKYSDDAASPAMQQAEVNLLADQGAQPTTLMAGLSAATKSTDTVGPTVTITDPTDGTTQSNGAKVTLTGTATDAGGGQVAGVEYSTDAGTSWHPASGTSSWTLTYVQHGIGNTAVRVRAVDDSANIGTAATRTFNVTCPCSVLGNQSVPTTWNSNMPPATASANDTSASELGLRFTPAVDGYISGVRFYKGAGNTGTHVGTLWSSSGQQLAQVTFTNESNAGWQTATFTQSVAVAAGVSYVVSYTDPNGHYAVQPWAFGTAGVNAYPLSVDGGFGATPASVYGAMGRFPAQSYQSASYYVDPLFTTTDDSPLAAVSQWPLDGASSVPRTTTVSAKFTKPVQAATVHMTVKDELGNSIGGATSYDPTTRTATFTPNAALSGFVTYTATLVGTDTNGIDLSIGGSWSFRTAKPPAAPGVCPCSLFDEDSVPTILQAPEKAQLTLGVRFTPDADGTVTGIRFYKDVNNAAPHVGTLWSASGTALATGTFTNESTSGWQTLTFDQPVQVQANTTYVASYRTNGYYSATPNAFASADLSKGPLHVTSTAGAYSYGTGFPSSSSATSYAVDVAFEKATPTLTITGQDPAPGATAVPRGSSINATFSLPLTGGALSATAGGVPVDGVATTSTDGKTLTFTPSAVLPADTDVTVTASNVAAGTLTMATKTWTFHTRAAETSADQTLFGDVIPAVPAQPDSAAVEVGTVFTPAKDGQVTAIRFYKGTGNGGTHTGSLWSTDGTRLATVTFTNETATGWQQANLTNPVHVTAGTSYVVSYLAPQGHYATTTRFFTSAYTSGDLSAPAGSNGRYLYGTAGGMPTYAYNSSNYFVDVVFNADAPKIAIASRAPDAGATNVDVAARPTVTFSASINDGAQMSLTTNGQVLSGTSSLSTDRRTLTFTPTSSLPANANVTVRVGQVTSTEGAVLLATSWSFTTEPPSAVSLFTTTTPATTAVTDKAAVEVGLAFTTSSPGQVTAIRFYKGAGNTGTHTGSLWSADGTRLATVTFASETESGWQTAVLPSPVTLTPGAMYVVSYYAPNGHYASTSNALGTAVTSGPLSTLVGNNGRYVYASGGGFPTKSYNASNYFVDVRFQPTS